MNKKNFYLAATIVGTILPYVFFTDFIKSHGLNFSLFTTSLFANGATGGITTDLSFSILIFFIWSYMDSRKHSVRHWWIAVILTLGIGLSSGLPFYFYERAKAENVQS